MKGMSSIAAAALIISSALVLVGCSHTEDPPLVFAAASLVDVMEDIGSQYEKGTGEKIRFNFGGSNLLANQIASGAPADAVIVAGSTPIDALIEHGALSNGDAVPVFTNRLVVVGPAGSKSRPTDLTSLADAGRIAMPDPVTAPAGEYFEAALRERGLWDVLQPQIIPTLDVRAALAAVATGNVSFALVYETDAISTDDAEIVLAIDGGSEITRPKYYASRLSNGHNAERFIRFLASPQAISILESYGFSPWIN